MKYTPSLLCLLTLVACTPEETPADMSEPGFDLVETFDMPPAVDMPEDMPARVDMSPADMPPVVDMPPDMPPADMPPADMPPADTPPDMPATETLGGARPAEVTLPASYDGTRELPLVLALHGYGGDKDSVGRYFSLKRNVDDRDFILVSPEGNRDTLGTRFWNATPACCDGFKSGVDDAAYLRGLIEEALEKYSIDRGRIYVAGYSNGGFMSYRLACDSADYVTGIFVLAGGTFKDMSSCQPSQPVQILHLHGTADGTIRYEGGTAFPTAPAHPGAVESVTTWASYNGCQTTPTALDATDVDAVTVETASVTGFEQCPAQGQVELWTLPDAPHNPGLPRTMGTYILDRFFAIDRTP